MTAGIRTSAPAPQFDDEHYKDVWMRYRVPKDSHPDPLSYDLRYQMALEVKEAL